MSLIRPLRAALGPGRPGGTPTPGPDAANDRGEVEGRVAAGENVGVGERDDGPVTGADMLFLKHDRSILRQSCNPVCGSWKSQASSLWAKQHRA